MRVMAPQPWGAFDPPTLVGFPGHENRFVKLVVLTSGGVHIYNLCSQLPIRPTGYVNSGSGGEISRSNRFVIIVTPESELLS